MERDAKGTEVYERRGDCAAGGDICAAHAVKAWTGTLPDAGARASAYAANLKGNAMKWDDYFMNIARAVSMRSKDHSRKVGCVIVGPDNEIRATGYNSFPRGINDNAPERHERPEK